MVQVVFADLRREHTGLALHVCVWARRAECTLRMVARRLARKLLLCPSEEERGWFVILNPGYMLESTEMLLKGTGAQVSSRSIKSG